MKTEELMIGDWVYVTSVCGWECDPIAQQIRGIEYNSYQGDDYCDWVSTDCDDEVSLFNINPIPLTAEILEKNEFELQEQDFTNKLYRLKYGILYLEPYSSNIKDGYRVGCSITNYDHFNVHTRFLSSFCKVYYVHELQHVLRLCGLCELANNFKI